MLKFSKKQRLIKKREYKEVFSKKIKVERRFFIAMIRKNNVPFARLGMAIAKKHIKLAVARNRVKRIIRESFRLYNHTYNVDIVIVSKIKIEKIEKKEVWQDLEEIFFKIGLKIE